MTLDQLIEALEAHRDTTDETGNPIGGATEVYLDSPNAMGDGSIEGVEAYVVRDGRNVPIGGTGRIYIVARG